MSDAVDRISLGISSCLAGENVRYDGGNKLDTYLTETLAQSVDWVKFCPEVAAGLGVPRPPMQLQYQKDKIRAVVIEDPKIDHTKALKQTVDDNRELFRPLNGYVVKSRSPSCGRDSAPICKNGKKKGVTSGIFTRRFMKQFTDIPVIDSEVLEDPTRRENFILRAFVLARWQKLNDQGLSADSLARFHNQHQHLIRCHNQCAEKELRQIVTKANKKKLKTRAASYRSLLMKTLRVLSSRTDHLRTLQALASEAKKDLSKGDMKAVLQAVDDFGNKKCSLEHAVSVFRDLVAEQKGSSLQADVYLNPYPTKLKLRENLFSVKS